MSISIYLVKWDCNSEVFTWQVVEDYKAALPVYEDFHQKRQLQKLRKLLQDKAALPIAAFETHIVDAVRANPAVVVAGDTGDALLPPLS